MNGVRPQDAASRDAAGSNKQQEMPYGTTVRHFLSGPEREGAAALPAADRMGKPYGTLFLQQIRKADADSLDLVLMNRREVIGTAWPARR